LSLVGPKARPQGVVDGCQVDIPEPGADVEYVGTLLQGQSRRWLSAFPQGTSGVFGQNEAGDGGVAKIRVGVCIRPYRKPTQVGA
jgi:hypothetical protein